MILNMPTNIGNTNPTLDSSGHGLSCEYNFLKRKLDNEDTMPNLQQQIRTNDINATTIMYQDTTNNNSIWKKRHLEDEITQSTNTAQNCFNENDFNTNNNLNETYDTGNSVLNTDTNGIQNSADMTFSLISNSFINDLFAYDANLIVPVSVSPAAIPNDSTNNSNMCATSAATTYTTPTNVCASNSFDDGTNWQATDLLELDHRYNSGLQTDITHLNPTVPLKDVTQDTIPLSSPQTELQQQQPQQQHQQRIDSTFLVPQKQYSRPQATAHIKYRQQQNLSQAEINNKNDTETDFEDKNLSWLLNFKFDELPHLSPDLNSNSQNIINANNSNSCKTKSSSPSVSHSECSRSPKSKVGKKFEELVLEATSEMDANDLVVSEHVTIEDSSFRTPKKPPFTYTELIEYALEDKGELTVSGIYQWISDRFPYYKSNDDRWKNSVRHNLSINPHFRKGSKAPQGAGHLWTISSGDSAENILAWEHKKQRLDLFFKMETMNRERIEQHQKQLLEQQKQKQQCTSPNDNCLHEQPCTYDEAATAAATITQEMLHHAESIENCATSAENKNLNNNHMQIVRELPFNDLMCEDELRKSAGQILNGIHREVEVQPVNALISTYHDALLDNDYLNPVQKNVPINGEQSRSVNHMQNYNASSQYYITEIDPIELGIQDETAAVLFNDDFNLNYFSYNPNNDIVA